MCQGVSCCAHEAVSGYQKTTWPSPTTHIFMLYSRALYSTLYRRNRLYIGHALSRVRCIVYNAIQRYTTYTLYSYTTLYTIQPIHLPSGTAPIATPGSVRPGAAPPRAHTPRPRLLRCRERPRPRDEMMTALDPGVFCTRRPVHRPIVPRLRLGW